MLLFPWLFLAFHGKCSVPSGTAARLGICFPRIRVRAPMEYLILQKWARFARWGRPGWYRNDQGQPHAVSGHWAATYGAVCGGFSPGVNTLPHPGGLSGLGVLAMGCTSLPVRGHKRGASRGRAPMRANQGKGPRKHGARKVEPRDPVGKHWGPSG